MEALMRSRLSAARLPDAKYELEGDAFAHSPSLRAKRSNPDCHRGGILDCFATLAMTMWLQLHAASTTSRPVLPDHPAELVRLRESLRRETTGVGAEAFPLGELLHGRREFAARGVFPGQASLGVEHGNVGEAAVLVLLQTHTAAAGHLRHLVEREDQHLAVLADDRDGVAEHLGDRARLV